MRPVKADRTKLSLVAKALSHPLRISILRSLIQGSMSPSKLGLQLDAPTPEVAYHVRQLRKFGLIHLVKRKRGRGSFEHFYEATAGTDLHCCHTFLDSAGREDVEATLIKAAEQVFEAEAKAAERLAKAGLRGEAITIILGSFGHAE